MQNLSESEHMAENAAIQYYDPDLQDFINTANLQDKEPTFTLYRLSRAPGGGKFKEGYLEQYNEPPHPDYIRNTFGSGEYRVTGDYTDRSGKRCRKSAVLNIEDVFGMGFRGALPALPAPPAPIIQNDNSGMAAMVQMMQTQNQNMFALLSQVIVAALQKNGETPAPAQLDPLGIQKTLQQVIQNSAQNQMEVINNMIAHKANELAPGSQDEPEEDGGFISEMIATLFEKWGPKILKGSKATQRVYREMAQGTDEFEMLTKDPKQYAIAYKSLLDNGADQKNLDAVITILGAPSPNLELVDKE